MHHIPYLLNSCPELMSQAVSLSFLASQKHVVVANYLAICSMPTPVGSTQRNCLPSQKHQKCRTVPAPFGHFCMASIRAFLIVIGCCCGTGCVCVALSLLTACQGIIYLCFKRAGGRLAVQNFALSCFVLVAVALYIEEETK